MGDAPLLDVIGDLSAEHEALDAVLEALDDPAWDTPTPAPGWRVRDQIGHLAHYDGEARRAVVDPEGFSADLQAALVDIGAFAAAAEALGRTLTGTALLDEWRARRALLLDALAHVPEGARLPWYGPSMSLRSFTTARLMETWAHGQDVVDAVDRDRPDTDRLRHVCHLGASTFGWSWRVRGEEPPAAAVRVELTLPSGAPWVHGPEGAGDVVRGSARDFCLVVTQRRHVTATALEVAGPVATAWMARAQCFAGGPTLTPDPVGDPTPEPAPPE